MHRYQDVESMVFLIPETRVQLGLRRLVGKVDQAVSGKGHYSAIALGETAPRYDTRTSYTTKQARQVGIGGWKTLASGGHY